MKRIELIQKIVNGGVVAVVRADSKEKALKIVDALKKGGIFAIEITMTVPNAIEIIKEISEEHKDVIIGAGTVLDPETARACILAGATYIISPHLNPEVVKMCNRYRVAVMPGIMTVKEAVEAMELGAEILKVFPGGAFGPNIIKDFRGPLPHVNLMPTGGVDLNNAHEWIKNGAIALGVGSALTKGAKNDDYEIVTKTAREFIKIVKQTRNEILANS